MEGWGWRSVHDPKELSRVDREWKDCLGKGEPFTMGFPLRSKSGAYQWFLTRVVPLKDSAGNVVRWFGTNTNIQEQKITGEALKITQDRLLLATQASGVGVGEYDLESGVTWRHANHFESRSTRN